ncbi:MAG TPA: hypothetical protein VE404_02310, partial [Verrucomicrobiae bacterium]|nr:hypothetical protein [Verrucomicrobiae bacterium]
SDHEGAWAAFSGGARAALFMPAKPAKGARYYQELAPAVAMDRVEIVGIAESVKTPAGSFEGCVMTEETTPLEPEVRDHKIYARGVGVAKEDDLLLVKYGFVGPKSP